MEKSKTKTEKSKKVVKKVVVVDELTDEEREAVTIVFHQFETGLREGTILVKVTSQFWLLTMPSIPTQDNKIASHLKILYLLTFANKKGGCLQIFE